MNTPPPPRLHILAAKEAPVVVILRRGPSKCYHCVHFNTQTNEVEHGSWFNGRIYHFRCDLSHDGKYMVYLAMGSNGETWNGVCRPPWLKCVSQWETEGAWFGGGVWHSSKKLAVNLDGHPSMPCFKELTSKTISKFEPEPIEYTRHDCDRFGEDEGVIYARLIRDGWKWQGQSHVEKKAQHPYIEFANAGWLMPSRQGWPPVHLYFRKYESGKGRIFEFDMKGHPDFFSPSDDWATFDTLGNLIIARNGCVEKWTIPDIDTGVPSFVIDLNNLTPPGQVPCR